MKDFNAGILTAAHTSIPRGARQNFKSYWSEELERLDEELSAARREAETNPSQDNHNHLQHTKARFLRWRNKTASLNLEKDGTKLCRLTKQLNDECNGRATTTLETDGQHLSCKHAANKLSDNYEEVTTSQSPSNTNVKHEGSKGKGRHTKLQMTSWTKKLTLNELQAALRQLKAKKSSGPDSITNEILGNKATCKLLEIFNHSWATGRLTLTQSLRKRKTPNRQPVTAP